MSTLAATAPLEHPRALPLGRMFVSPVFDFLLIGGGLSLCIGAIAWAGGLRLTQDHVPAILLLGNFAHFAASTVRLYVTPGATRRWPMLTLGFPLACLLVFTAVLALADWLVRYVFAVFLVWSPYHYAAQAYGLSMMYAYRSDCSLSDGDKRLVRLVCLAPFVWALLRPQGGIGVTLKHLGVVAPLPLEHLRVGVSMGLSAVALAAPLVLFVLLRAAAVRSH